MGTGQPIVMTRGMRKYVIIPEVNGVWLVQFAGRYRVGFYILVVHLLLPVLVRVEGVKGLLVENQTACGRSR